MAKRGIREVFATYPQKQSTAPGYPDAVELKGLAFSRSRRMPFCRCWASSLTTGSLLEVIIVIVVVQAVGEFRRVLVKPLYIMAEFGVVGRSQFDTEIAPHIN